MQLQKELLFCADVFTRLFIVIRFLWFSLYLKDLPVKVVTFTLGVNASVKKKKVNV